MTLDTLLTVLLDLAFFAVFAFTFVDWIRHRGAIRRAVVLVFGSVAIVLAAPLLGGVHPTVRAIATLAVVPALLAQPVLALRLVALVLPVSKWLLTAAAVAFGVLSAIFLVALVSRVTSATPAGLALIVGVLVYFVAVETAAAVGFALAARRRAGASRSRLKTAAAATAMLGISVAVLIGSGLVVTRGSADSAVATNLGRVIALLSALGYLAAFAPPRILRRLSQQGIVYDFVRELNALPSGSPIDRVWGLLERTAQGASGASRVAVVADRAATTPAPAAATQRLEVPFHSQRWPDGRLELDVPRDVLFVDDDLELIGLLVDRGVRAAERESFLAERERLIAELQAASAAKSDFLAAMSHELRTPLNAIIGFSDLLREGDEDAGDPATVTSYAEHIHQSGLHLLELVNDVLDLARVEAGRLDLKPARFDLDALVRQTVASLQPLADQKRLTVQLHLAPLAIEADPSRIRQVVLNLLSNAIKFTPDGGEIRLSLDGEGGSARLAVADTGRGIAAADLDRIFEAFHQGEGGRSSHHEGTGLGLALTRQLVEAHGGRIAVHSAPGAGSEFTVHLPLGMTPAATSSEHPPVLPSDRPSVLVIEDDPAAQELLRVHLEGAGYAVLATESGRQGLAWMAEARPAAVLLDILLPDVDGWEVLQRAKSDPATRSIPIMVVSVVDDRALGLALGAVDYVVKPVSRERLLEALGRLTFTTKVRSRTVTALVIDADPEVAEAYRRLLEPDGFRVIGATDAATGTGRAREDRPDLILLDALLPDAGGFELIRALGSDPATAGIPIWLTTPAGLPADAKARLNGTVQGVLTHGDDALAALHAWLSTGAGPGSGTSAPGAAAQAQRQRPEPGGSPA